MIELREFELTQAQFADLLDACKPVPYLLVSGGFPPPSPQDMANGWWIKTGREMGFDPYTVQPLPAKGHRFFMAYPYPPEESPASHEQEEKHSEP